MSKKDEMVNKVAAAANKAANAARVAAVKAVQNSMHRDYNVQWCSLISSVVWWLKSISSIILHHRLHTEYYYEKATEAKGMKIKES